MSLPFWLGEPRYQVWDVHCTTILAIYTALLHTNNSSNTYPKPLPYEIFIIILGEEQTKTYMHIILVLFVWGHLLVSMRT